MKRILTTLVVALSMAVLPNVQAANVTVEQAKDAAAHYLQQRTALTRITADDLTLARQWNNPDLDVPSMYLFKTVKEGWIIIAATTVTNPIVAYSEDEVIDANNLIPPVEWWLGVYNEIVCLAQNEDAQKPLPDSPEWTKLLTHSMPQASKASQYLLSTKWDQGGIRGLDYNMYCPVVRDTVCPVGCVATALAQICKYYSYPAQPTGYKTYYWYSYGNGTGHNILMQLRYSDSAAIDYSIMPNSIQVNANGSSVISVERRKEVSRLGYYLGVAVEMQYGPDGSGTTTDIVTNNMRRFFKYTQGDYLNRRTINDTAFLNGVRREIKMNRPVYMSGASSTGSGRDAAGHAWVCDGVKDDEPNMYHMNWGWGGSGNTWYDLGGNQLAAGGYNFNAMRNGSYQTAIVGMVPPPDSTDRDIYVGIPRTEEDVVLGNAYPNPATINVTLPYRSNNAAELHVFNVSGQLIASCSVVAGEGEVVMNVDQLPAGLYIYRIGNTHGKFVVR